MTREQIEEKARDFCKEDVYGCNECCDECVQEIEKQKMIDLANWALFHQWVSVEDELPPKKERYSKYVIMRNRIGGHYIGCYDFEEKLWIDGKLEIIYMDITHWMPIPPLAEEGGNNE